MKEDSRFQDVFWSVITDIYKQELNRGVARDTFSHRIDRVEDFIRTYFK